MLIFESNGCSDCKSSNTRSITVSGNNFSSLYPTSVLISLKNLRSSEVKGSCERLAKIPLSTTRLFTSAKFLLVNRLIMHQTFLRMLLIVLHHLHHCELILQSLLCDLDSF